MKKLIVYLVCLSIILNFSFGTQAIVDERGDTNLDGFINAIDMLNIRKYILKYEFDVQEYIFDVTLDDDVDVKDLVRIKKYLVGANKKIHSNSYNVAYTWAVPFDDSGLAAVIPVTYNFFISGTVYTDYIHSRYTEEIRAYARTDRSTNSLIPKPDMTIGITSVNSVQIYMSDAKYQITPTDWITVESVGYPNCYTKQESTYSCILSFMISDAVYPLRQTTNTFNF